MQMASLLIIVTVVVFIFDEEKAVTTSTAEYEKVGLRAGTGIVAGIRQPCTLLMLLLCLRAYNMNQLHPVTNNVLADRHRIK